MNVVLATTGISGPDGGTPEKPVGLVHLALARAESGQARNESRNARSESGRARNESRNARSESGRARSVDAAIETHADHFVFPLDRTRHRMLTAQIALDWVRRALLGVELEGPTLMRRRGGASTPGR